MKTFWFTPEPRRGDDAVHDQVNGRSLSFGILLHEVCRKKKETVDV